MAGQPVTWVWVCLIKTALLILLPHWCFVTLYLVLKAPTETFLSGWLPNYFFYGGRRYEEGTSYFTILLISLQEPCFLKVSCAQTCTHTIFKSVVLQHASESEGTDFCLSSQTPDFLIQQVWSKSQECTFLTSPWVLLMLLVKRPHFEPSTQMVLLISRHCNPKVSPKYDHI